ncbi:MAG: type IV pilus secretin PilQ [Candidatus Acidiferrales bacterium]
MRIIGRGWRLGALLAAGLILSNGALPGADAAPVVHVKAVVQDGTVRLEAQANAPFEYTTYRPSKSLYVLDMTGVSSGDDAGARVVASDLVKSYRVLSYTADQKPVVRLEILLSDGVEPRIERKDSQDVALLVGRTPEVAPAADPSVTSAPAVVPAAVKSTETSDRATTLETIQQVNLSQKGGQTQVSIFGTGRLDCHAIALQNPDRLVLDFAGSHLGAPVGHHIASNLDPVREIRLAQFTPKVSRVVIDLREPAAYKMDAAGNSVTVSFAPAATGAVEAAPAEPAPNLTTTEAKSPKSDVEVTASTEPAQIPAPATFVPAVLTQPSSAVMRPVVAQMQPQATAAATQAAENASAAASQSGNTATAPESQGQVQTTPVEPSQMPEAQTPAPTPAPSSKYSGEPISVNLKDVDLDDFFRLIHEISGLNVVVDPAVKGTVTIVLEDVPWDQALDIVLHNNNLDKQLDGNVLRIATKETLRKEAEDSRDLIKAQEEAVDMVTTTRTLSYTKATAMAALLKKFLSPRGDILPDIYSNSLVIRDIPSTLPVIDNLIRQLDRKSLQVEIEARVVEADRNFLRELGTELSLSGRSGNSALGGTSAVGSSETTFTPAPPIFVGSGGGAATSGKTPSVFSLGANAPTSGIQYLFASPNFALDFVIDAAESRGVGKLLSEPKVITQNNQKATVKQGVKIPIQTDVNNTISIQYVDAVLELDVTPQITAEGTIYMDVSIENDQPNEAVKVQGTPEVITQSADTKVTVDDGATVVVGGIIVTSQTTSVDQVPILGSVPLLGNLFKHSSVSSTSKELLFFLTPRILPS